MTQQLSDLISQRDAINAQIEALRAEEKSNALAEIRRLIAQFGLTSSDVFTATKTKSTKTVAPKYKDPVSGATWTGRGKAPTWIAGKDRNLFMI